MKRAVLLAALLLGGILLAQQSASYRLTESAFNAGGHPHDGVVLTSTSYRLTLGTAGQAVTTQALGSTSYGMEAGFLGGLPPPGEVTNLRFTDATTLVWDPERSVGVYNLYQGAITHPFDPSYGTCQTAGIATETTTVTAELSPGEGIFVLVTAENRLDEEGTKGHRSSGPERPNPSPCP